ncbi:MAG: Flp pilus assembly protein CpaB [Rhizobiales bacterium]|nr:Flp pilus assembly protein CpaB [Hyphomicrobiales bacterium]
MKLSRVAILGVALVAGLVAAFLALNLNSGPAPAPAPIANAPSIALTKVLVASRDIPMGTRLSDSDVSWRDWPRTASSPNFIEERNDPEAMKGVIGSLARATIYSGEPLTTGKLIRSDVGFMSAILPAGKRAVATKIAADTSAGGFILPNDRVDVIMTRQTGSGDNGGAPPYRTETILNNVRVLAIDQTIEEKNGEKVVVGQTATLELSPQQAEILTVAQQMSERLTLALRSIADSQSKPTDADQYAVHLIAGSDRKTGIVKVVRNGIVSEQSSIR